MATSRIIAGGAEGRPTMKQFSCDICGSTTRATSPRQCSNQECNKRVMRLVK
jgi:hypothetical protein